ncbi:MAG: DUF1289 domain-containing protein [Burkholderiales bacterium]
MDSPCIRVCVMDGDLRYCLGCWRTLDEITRWGTMSEAEQADLIAQLAARRAASASNIAEVPAAPPA